MAFRNLNNNKYPNNQNGYRNNQNENRNKNVIKYSYNKINNNKHITNNGLLKPGSNKSINFNINGGPTLTYYETNNNNNITFYIENNKFQQITLKHYMYDYNTYTLISKLLNNCMNIYSYSFTELTLNWNMIAAMIKTGLNINDKNKFINLINNHKLIMNKSI